jgi:hypothetical protein
MWDRIPDESVTAVSLTRNSGADILLSTGHGAKLLLVEAAGLGGLRGRSGGNRSLNEPIKVCSLTSVRHVDLAS